MNPHAYLVVMAGGSGTRFWPKSTSRKPKQLLAFGSAPETLLQQTLNRFSSFVAPERKMIVTTQTLFQSVAKQAAGVQVLSEPQARNTAPCVYWAAREIYARDSKGVMMVMPSDHYIAFSDRFNETVARAVEWATRHDDLVTLGVKPTRPETGYGYLKVAPSSEACSRVEAFVEKPNLEKAQAFLKAGNYLWNGGMFIWRAECILKAFDQFMPEMKRAWDESQGQIAQAYPLMTATSIDYGIMEKAKNVVTFALDCGWDDLGSWTSLESLSKELGAVRGENVVTAGELLAIEARGNIVDTPGKFTAVLGMNDLIVVEHEGAILIAPKNRAQDIRLIVEQVKKIKPELA